MDFVMMEHVLPVSISALLSKIHFQSIQQFMLPSLLSQTNMDLELATLILLLPYLAKLQISVCAQVKMEAIPTILPMM